MTVSGVRGSPRASFKRAGMLQQLTCLLTIAIILATTGSVTLALSRASRTGASADSARLRASGSGLSAAQQDKSEDDNLVSLFPPRSSNVTSDASLFPKVLVLTPVKNSARHIERYESRPAHR